jgi:hypothetical protein
MAAFPSFLFQGVVHSVKSRLGNVFVADEKGYLKFKRYCGNWKIRLFQVHRNKKIEEKKI